MVEQRIRPTIIMPDTTPLVHLAAVDALPVLNGLGSVVVVDVVMLEATTYQGKPCAREIAAWIEAGGKPDSNRPVEIAATELGPLYKLALDQGLKPPRNAGEIAIAEWLADELRHLGGPALVVYENDRVPAMLAREGVTATVAVATTRNLLELWSKPTINRNSSKIAIQNFRSRLHQRGLARFEVLGREDDRELIRSLARRLTEDGPAASRLRSEVNQAIAGEPRKTGGVVAALLRSPLIGSELDLDRPRVEERKIGL